MSREGTDSHEQDFTEGLRQQGSSADYTAAHEEKSRESSHQTVTKETARGSLERGKVINVILCSYSDVSDIFQWFDTK